MKKKRMMRKISGIALVATPFVAIVAAMIAKNGVVGALVMLGATGLIGAFIWGGLALIEGGKDAH